MMPLATCCATIFNWIEVAMVTSARYYPNSSGLLSAPLKDTWRVAISPRLADVLLAPTQPPSPYRALLEPRTVVLFGSSSTSWNSYLEHLQQLVAWGLD